MHRKELKSITAFESKGEEREFWAEHDSAEYVDWQAAGEVRLPGLEPTTRTISIRLPETMLEDLMM